MKLLIFDLDDTLFDSTGQTPGKLDIRPFEGAEEVLKMPGFTKVLVTYQTPGDADDWHDTKINALNIRHYFDEIHLCPHDKEKYEYFKEIIDRYKPKNTIVIGNRIDSELRFGKQLGAETIYYKHGKYSKLEPKDQYEIPDHTVLNMKELKDLLSDYSL